MASMVEDPDVIVARLGPELLNVQVKEEVAERKFVEVGRAVASLQTARADGNQSAVTAAEATLLDKHQAANVASTALRNAMVQQASRTGVQISDVAGGLHELGNAQDRKRYTRLLEASETADICFVLDATGSMDPYREGICQQIRDCIGHIQQNVCADYKFRIACVAFRDVGYTPRFEVHNFSGSISSFGTFLSNLRTSGVPQNRQDRCEDALGGLDQASKLTWRYQARIVFLVGDEPCHGIQYHDYGSDRPSYDEYPLGVFEGSVDGMKTLSKLREQCGVQSIQFMKITDKTDKMIRVFNEMTGNEGFVEEHKIDSTSQDTIAKGITKCVRNSLEMSLSKSHAAASKAYTPKTHFAMEAIMQAEEEDEEEEDNSSDYEAGCGSGTSCLSPGGISNNKLQSQLAQLKKFYDKKLFSKDVYDQKVREMLLAGSA